MNSHSPLLEATNLTKSYNREGTQLDILKGVSIEIEKGESVCIMGASGAGKSTLLQILGTLDKADSGNLSFQGTSLIEKEDEEISKFRADKLGFIFQFHHLLNEFNVLENVLMPFWIRGLPANQAYALQLLEKIGMSSRIHHYPTQLSGGECQRVALARALVKKPALILADEPTGNLDSQNGLLIQQLLFDLQKETQSALIVVTHDENMARRFSKKMKLHDGHWVR
jgi:lipoprotein-releasing system ATP-binding protein